MKINLSYFLYTLLLSAIACACSDDLSINQMYSFDLSTMPFRKEIAQGETREIRCKLTKEGDFNGTKYYIRYFQSEGEGEFTLNLFNGTVLNPNDTYPLDIPEFTIYYTSHCTENQKIDVYITDNFGQEVFKTFSFDNKKIEEEKPIDLKFDFSTLPIQSLILNGDTVEIRCQIKKEDKKNDAQYSIRYFQTYGTGKLLYNGVPLNPNDLYPLDGENFYLYYIPECDVKQSIDIYIVDSNGQIVSKTFNFDPILIEPEPEIDISFEFYTLPVQKTIAEDKIAEIRCQIKKTDPRNHSTYKIRYFQPDGKGELRMQNGILFQPNDLYSLYNDVFRLYYTSRSSVQQVIDVYIEDSNGQIIQKTFNFSPEIIENKNIED